MALSNLQQITGIAAVGVMTASSTFLLASGSRGTDAVSGPLTIVTGGLLAGTAAVCGAFAMMGTTLGAKAGPLKYLVGPAIVSSVMFGAGLVGAVGANTLHDMAPKA